MTKGAKPPMRKRGLTPDQSATTTQRPMLATSVAMVARLLALLFAALVIFFAVRHFREHGAITPAVGDRLFPLLISSLGLLLAGTVVVLRPERETIAALAATATAWSIALLLALAGAWYLIDASAGDGPLIGTVVVNRAEANSYLERVLPPPPSVPSGGTNEPWRIPTGILLQSLEFSNANDVSVSGYVWQTFPSDVPPEVPRGVDFPEATLNAAPTDPAYQVVLADGNTLIGWQFHLTLRQNFEYDRYPFDRQDVWLVMWAKDFQRRVVLVPDFASYRSSDPRALPGIGNDFVQSAWIAERSEFSYAQNQDNTSFGLPASFDDTAFPELSFNLSVKRRFLEPFLDHILFAVVVAILLFLILCLTARDDDTKKRFGISTFGVLGTCSGLLFAVILKDGQIRQTVASGEIVYIEVLPFLLYAAILLVAANALVLDSPIRNRFVDYRNNLLPDLVYWPALLGTLLVITLWTFF